MWKFLYQLASPKYFYQWTGKMVPWLGSLALIALTTGLIWGLFFAPADYQQQDAFRIIYIHVPSAFLSLSLYAFMFFLAMLLIVWRIKIAGLILIQTAKMGACLAALALITGSIWGKPMWGTWWIWDARLTTVLILWLIYVAYLLVRAYASATQTRSFAAVVGIIGFVDVPIVFMAIRWWRTIHPGPVVQTGGLSSTMLYTLIVCLIAFTLFYGVLMALRFSLRDAEEKVEALMQETRR